MKFESPKQFRTNEQAQETEDFSVIDNNDRPELWPHLDGLQALDKYKQNPRIGIAVLNENEMNALERYLESDVCSVGSDVVRNEILSEIKERRELLKKLFEGNNNYPYDIAAE